MTWRVGRKLGRTLYRDEVCVGMVDTPEIAAEIVSAVYAVTEARSFWDDVDSGHPAIEREKATAAERDQLRADVERLHRLLDERWRSYDTTLTKLADATALLERTYAQLKLKGTNLGKDYDAFLAGQPAAPVVTMQVGDQVEDVGDYFHAVHEGFAARESQPAAPTRTEAEQAVLDAMGEIELGVLEAIRDKHSCAPAIFHPPCLAELARRGLPP